MFEPIEFRKQCEDNRQSSSEVIDPHIPVSGGYIPASTLLSDHLVASRNLYNQLIDAGVAREQARMILPLATKTKIYMTGTLRSWIHFLSIRDDGHAQKEIQLIAKEIKVIFKDKFPIISNALDY
jgi:thymidylate synthase (FAD)